MRAYDECYLLDAMENLGEAFDYASFSGVSPDEFATAFVSSGLAERFGRGDASVVSGRSGTELAADVFSYRDPEFRYVEQKQTEGLSPAYWCGYILAYYQWLTGNRFRDVFARISPGEVLSLYPALHEADDDKVASLISERIRKRLGETNLQRLRKKAGLTQKELSSLSGVNLRTLQQYEIRGKDINKASLLTVIRLADILKVEAGDLSEFNLEEME